MSNIQGGDIDVGLFRSKVTFLNNAPIANQSGGYVDNYIAFLTTWGQLRQNNGMRSLSTGEIVVETDFTLFTRYQLALASALVSNTLIQIPGDAGVRTFTINSWSKVEEMN